jgi:hypothetical protein
MASREELAQLRAETLNAHRKATRKVSRLKTQNGVSISGSNLDPRRSPAIIKRYNSKQLAAYQAKLESFVDRRVQYHPDKNKRPMAKFGIYKSLEKQYNRIVNNDFNAVKDLELPSGRKIEERFKLTTADRRSSRGRPVNAPYDPPVRESTHFTSERALNSMIKDMKKRLEADRPTKNVKKSKTQLNQMVKTIEKATQDKKLRAALKDLTPDQFRVLWNYTTLATDINIGYEEAMKLLGQRKGAYKQSRHEAHTEYAHDLIKWAKKLEL